MSTLAILHDLTPIFIALGRAGLIMAVSGALIVMVGTALRGGSAAGLGTAVWVSGAVLSIALVFGQEWALMFACLVALPAALVAGVAARTLLERRARFRPARSGSRRTVTHESDAPVIAR